MKREEVNIRDPFVMVYKNTYYLYGTRSATCWGKADGFDCYKSKDLENWEGPFEIFHKPDRFFTDQNYWAPECYCINDMFYLVTTFGSENEKKGIYVLRAEKPEGPFVLHSERITPADWSCIDGTLYWEAGHPYLIFSHSFEDSPNGDMCLLRMSEDLKQAEGEVKVLFSAGEAEWAYPVPFAKAEFGIDGDVYFTDGPCVFQMGESLYMLWSSWGTQGYAVGAAESKSGLVEGPWIQQKKPVFPENGGHGMVFRDLENKWRFTLHYPNDKYKEHPEFMYLEKKDKEIQLERGE